MVEISYNKSYQIQIQHYVIHVFFCFYTQEFVIKNHLRWNVFALKRPSSTDILNNAMF